ncbi:MAG: arginine--tRNA ligase [Bdellovibrionales bacterium]
MQSLVNTLSGLVGDAFAAQGLPLELGAVRVSDRPDLCQFQCNGAMAAAKVAKRNPREVAQGVVEALQQYCHSERVVEESYAVAKDPSARAFQDDSSGIFSKIEIAGPGFINLNVTDDYLAAHLAELALADDFGIPKSGTGQTVVLDYGGMNVAKAMHVGHLRSLAIGDCLKRLMRAVGYDAFGDIHLGDWGLQMGQIISEFEIRHPQWPYFDPDFDGVYPNEPLFSYTDLEEIYPQASAACKEDTDRLELARKATMELQNGRRGYVALWRCFLDLSIADIKANISVLDVDFEIWKGESDVNDLIPQLTDDLTGKGVLVESDGALVVPVARDDDKETIPPLMFTKSDGAATYGTTDVATIYDRTKAYPKLAKIIYETDLRQKLHFEQVFRTAQKAGYADGIALHHIGHGTVNGPDGKPFKTREGTAMKFSDMVAAVTEKAAQRVEEAGLDAEIGADERLDIARKVAVAVLKFTELSNQPHMDYNFDIDRMSRFEGKTGPYLLYQAVRIQSLLKKADIGMKGSGDEGSAPIIPSSQHLIIQDADRKLALLLTELPDQFAATLEQLSPHILCDYAYRLAQEFSSFYGNCHILSESDENIRASRLALCALTYRQLVFVLNILGICIPARM